MQITFELNEAIIITGKGEDVITLYLELPTTYPEMDYETSVTIRTKPGYATQWMNKNFSDVDYVLVDPINIDS